MGRIATSTPVLSTLPNCVDDIAKVLIYGRHCVGGSTEATCERKDRDYNVKLRIGLLFVILFTSAIGKPLSREISFF